MLYSIFLFVLGLIVGGFGVRVAGRSPGFTATPRGGVVPGLATARDVDRDKEKGERLIGQLLTLLGVIMIICAVIRLAAILLGSD